MRFSRVIGAFVLFLSSVCWSVSDIPLSSYSDPEFKIMPDFLAKSGLRLPDTQSHQQPDQQFYTLNLLVLETQLTAQVKTSVIGEQIIEIDLANLHHRKAQLPEDSTFLDKLLSMLALSHSFVRMEFNPTTQTATINSGAQVVETVVITKNTPRNDLPLLLEDEAAEQVFHAVDCARNMEDTMTEVHPCHNGFIQFSGHNHLIFEPLPEYQPAPTNLSTYETSSSLQFPLNGTIQVVLTLNPDGRISAGNAYSAEPEINTWGRKKKKGGGQKAERTGNGKPTQRPQTIYWSGGTSSSGTTSGGSGGRPPNDPHRNPDKPSKDAVSFDEEEEEEEVLKWAMGFEWPDGDKEAHLKSLPKKTRARYLREQRDSGYDTHSSLETLDLPEASIHIPHPKDKRSQWGDGDLRGSDQRSRLNKDYVKDGQSQKDWDNSEKDWDNSEKDWDNSE